MFSSEFFIGNRTKLRQLFTGTAPIIMTANGRLQSRGDTAYPFCQDASFWYYTGVDEPDIVWVCDKGKEYLIVPHRDEKHLVSEGNIDEAELRRISGIETIYDESQGWKRLGARLEKVKHVATLAAAPPYLDIYGMYSNPSRLHLIAKLKSHNPDLELLDIGEHVALMRMRKQAVEIAAIQQAVDCTVAAMRQTLRLARREKYAYEYEVEADISRGFRKSGAQRSAFEAVIAGGARACLLHYARNDQPLSADELLLCDVGAEYNHYAADITRTVSLSANPSRRQEMVFEATLAAHNYAVSMLKPGAIPATYESQIRQFMGEKLRELGLIKSIDQGAVYKFFPHRTAHFLGLNAHDIGSYDIPLEPGMVLAVEPGIYIRSEAIGIRLEDDVLITEDGNRLLSAALPKSLV